MVAVCDHFAEARREAELARLTPPERERLEALLWQLQARGMDPADERVPRYTAALLRRTGGGGVAVDPGGGRKPSPPSSGPEPNLDENSPDGWTWIRVGSALRAHRVRILRGFAVIALSLAVGRSRPVPLLIDNPVDTAVTPPSNDLTIDQPYTVDVTIWLLNRWTVSALLGIVAAAILGVLVARWWLQRRRRQLRRDGADGRAALTGISVRNARADFFNEPEFAAALRKLRRYRAVPSARIDVPGSIRATLSNCGMPTLRFAKRRLSPEYVILAEREAPHDHLPEIGAALDERLRGESIQSSRYEFSGDPNRLRFASEAGSTQSEPLDVVLARHEGAQMLVLMESFDALPPGSSAPRWVAKSLGSTVPWLIDPRGRDVWSHSESDLDALGVAVVTADTGGLTDLADRIDSAGDAAVPTGAVSAAGRPDLAAFLADHRDLLLSPIRPGDEQVINLIANLGRSLDRDGFDWLCALALFPMVHGGFTLFAGWTLKDAPILTHARYLALARMPWLRAAYMPDWLRRALVREMTPTGLARAAATAAAFLQPPRGAAETREDLIRLRQRAETKRAKRAMAKRLRTTRHPVFHDQLLLDALDGKAPDQLGMEAPSTLLERSATLWRRPESWAAAGALLAGGWVLTRDHAWQPEGWAIPMTVSETRIRRVRVETPLPPPPVSGLPPVVGAPAPPAIPDTRPQAADPILYFHVARADQMARARATAALMAGEKLDGRPIRVASRFQIIVESPAENQIRCFDSASCKAAKELSYSLDLNGFTGKVVRFGSMDLRTGTQVRKNQFEIWYGSGLPVPDYVSRTERTDDLLCKYGSSGIMGIDGGEAIDRMARRISSGQKQSQIRNVKILVTSSYGVDLKEPWTCQLNAEGIVQKWFPKSTIETDDTNVIGDDPSIVWVEFTYEEMASPASAR